MGRYDNYLLVTDMDGTLLNSQRQVSEKNRAAIDRFTAEGGRFCVATGRTAENVAIFLHNVNINTSGIFFNGAMLYDYKKQRIMAKEPLVGEIWQQYVELLLEKYPEICVQIYAIDTCYVVSNTPPEAPVLQAMSFPYKFSRWQDIQHLDWLKLMLVGEPELLHQAKEEAEKIGLMKISNSFFSESNFYEFVAANASKGHMLEVLKALPENQGRKVIAMGDYANDDYMLKMADVGIASGNAIPQTKQAADRVGVTCDEGLTAYVIDLIDKGEI